MWASSVNRAARYARYGSRASGLEEWRTPGSRSPFRSARIVLRSRPRCRAMAEIDHPRLLNACASTSSPLEIMGRDSFPLLAWTPTTWGEPPSVGRISAATPEGSGVGSFSDRVWRVSRDPQQQDLAVAIPLHVVALVGPAE